MEKEMLVRIVFYQPHPKFLGELPEDQNILEYDLVGYCYFSQASAGGDGVSRSEGQQKVFKIGERLFTMEAVRQQPEGDQCECTPGGMIRFIKYEVAHWVATPFVDGRIGTANSCGNPRFFRSEMKPLHK